MKLLKLFSVSIVFVSLLLALSPDYAFSIEEEESILEQGSASEELPVQNRNGARFLAPELTVNNFYSDILVCSSGEYQGWTVVCGAIAVNMQANASSRIQKINLPFASPLMIEPSTEWYFKGLPASNLQDAGQHSKVGLRYQAVFKNGKAYSFFLIRDLGNEDAQLFSLTPVEARKFKKHCDNSTSLSHPTSSSTCTPCNYYSAAGLSVAAGTAAGMVCGTCGGMFIAAVVGAPLEMGIVVGEGSLGAAGTVAALGIASFGLAKQCAPEAMGNVEQAVYDRCCCCKETAPATSRSIERAIPPFLVNSIAVRSAKD